MNKDQRRKNKHNRQKRNKEESIGPPLNNSHRGSIEEMKDDQGEEASEHVGLEEAGGKDAGGEEELEVEEHVQPEEDEDEAAEDAVEAVEVFMRGAEGEGVGVGGFEGEEVLDGELGDGDGAEAFGEVEEVWKEVREDYAMYRPQSRELFESKFQKRGRYEHIARCMELISPLTLAGFSNTQHRKPDEPNKTKHPLIPLTTEPSKNEHRLGKPPLCPLEDPT